MNKNSIIKDVNQHKGKRLHFIYNGSRNQKEDFFGTIENTYNSIFVIRIEGSNIIKTFTYNDVINKNLQFFI